MPNKILFFGELPPDSVHGVSLSNQLNIELLKEKYQVVVIREKVTLAEHGRFSLRKVISLASYIIKTWAYAIIHKFDYLYLTFSMSTMGAIKSLFIVSSFRLLSAGSVILHMHRGDFAFFYQKGINKFLADIIFKLVAKIIILSDKQRPEFTKVFHKKIEVLENSLNEEYNSGNKTFENKYFIYISNYIAEKGIIDLLEAFTILAQKYPDIRLACYGNHTIDQLKERILRYQSSFISISSGIYGREKANKIYQSYCLILPSWNEGQPLILLEAMSQGTPIVATDVGLVRDLLGENYPYICQPRRQDELLNTLELYLADDSKDKVSCYLKTRYRQLYSREIHKPKLLKIFNA